MVAAMALHVFPIQHFNPKEVAARPVQQVISGGVPLVGDEDVIATDGGGRWRVDYSGISLRTPFQQRVWSAWAGYLGGGTVDCLVPLLSLVTAPRPAAWGEPVRVRKLVADDQIFPESVRYSPPMIVARAAAPAALRATTLAIQMQSRGQIEGGEKFSIGEHAYRVVRPIGAGTYQIDPPLRALVTLNQPIEFNWPVVRARLAPGQDMDGMIRLGRFSDVSVSFIESVPSLVPA